MAGRQKARAFRAYDVRKTDPIGPAYVPGDSSVAKHDILYVSGTSGEFLELTKADADTALASSGTLLIAKHAATKDGSRPTGTAAAYGVITDVDTSAAAVGDPVFLSSTAGGWSLTASGLGRQVGHVLESDASAGEILFDGRGAGDKSGLRTIEGTIANAAVRTLNATEVTVIPAPGTGKAIEFVSGVWMLDYGSAAFDNAAAGEDLSLKYTDSSGAKVADDVDHSGFADATSDQYRIVKGVAVTPVANAPVVAHVLSGEWYSAAGDSDLQYKLTFRVIDLPS